MCQYCSVYTCKCQECEPLRVEPHLREKVMAHRETHAEHIEGRCSTCNHKFWMMVANF